MMKKSHRFVKAACAAGFSILLACRAFGADVTWTGGSGINNNWSTGANWSTGTVPPAGDVAVFQNVGGDVTVDVNQTIRSITVRGAVNATVTINSGVTLTIDNAGALGLDATGGDLTIEGPGLLAFSTAETTNMAGVNHLDNGANPERTLTINAQIIGKDGGTAPTGFETWRGTTTVRNGTVILGNPDNAFAMDFNAGGGHTVVAHKLSPKGLPSCIGAMNAFAPSLGTTLRYTGAGDTTTVEFQCNGGNAATLGIGGGIEQEGTGALTWAGPVFNRSGSDQTFSLGGGSAHEGRVSGDIYNAQGTLAVVKYGSGTWILSGSNAFTGAITIDAGTLGLDSINAADGASQVIMANGADLSVNPSATDGFNAAFPAIAARGNATLTIAPCATASSVTFRGLAAGAIAVTAPGAGTQTNRIFITGFPAGPVGSWLTLNGGPAQYDAVNGLRAVSLTSQGIAVKGGALPNGPAIQADINLPGTGGHITMPAPTTALFSLTQSYIGDDATIDTSGKLLMTGTAAIEASAGALTIGAAPQDGALLPLLQAGGGGAPVLPDNSGIATLAPLIWYDPSEAATVRLSSSVVTGLVNKGVGGIAMDAVVRTGWIGPVYAKGGESHSALPMLKSAINAQGLQSLSNTGILGNDPRTIIAVMSRDTSRECIVSIGAGASRLAFEPYLLEANTRFGTYSADLNQPASPALIPVVMTFQNGVGGDLDVCQAFVNGVAAPGNPLTHADPLNTSGTPLHLQGRNGATADNYRGQIGEVLLFDYVLDDTERETVETYLMDKWLQARAAPQTAALTLRNDSASLLTVNAGLTEAPGDTLSLTKAGPGSATLAGGTTLSGQVVLDAGTLTVATPANMLDTLSGIISGTGRLAKDSPGALFLPHTVANQYTGGTDILAGTLRVGNSRSIGTGGATVFNGATFDIGGGATPDTILLTNRFTVSGAGVDGVGALANTGTMNQRNAFQSTVITLAADAAFGGTAYIWDFRGGSVVDLAGNTLTKTGAADIRFSPASISNAPPASARHALDIQQGHLGIETTGTVFPNDDQRNINIGSAGRFGMYGLAAPIHWSVTAADGADIWTFGSDTATNKNMLTGPVAINGTLHLTSSGAFAKNLSGPISGNGGLFVHDGGENAVTLLSSPANAFLGNVAVSNATLGLRYTGSLPGGAGLTLANNTATGVRFFAGGDGWTGPEVAQLANSGLLGSVNHRFGIVVSEGDSAGLPALNPSIASTLDKYGPGALTLEGGAGPMQSNTRINGGTLVLTNSAAVLDLGMLNLLIKDANDWDGVNRNAYVHVGGDAQITSTDRGWNVSAAHISVGFNAGVGVLEVTDNARIQGRFYGAYNNTAAVGAIYQSGDSFILNTSGNANDTRFGHNGYAYWQMDDNAEVITKGYMNLGGMNNATSVGILRQKGGSFTFNGQRYTPLPGNGEPGESYNGILGISRGGTGVLHLEGGTFKNYAPFTLLDASDNASTNGTAIVTVAGTADVSCDRQTEMGSRTGASATLNLNGGTFTTTYILRKNQTTTTASVNFNGGTLRVPYTNAFYNARLLATENADAPFNAYVYEGGATIDLDEGVLRILDVPLQGPANFGLAGITIANGGTGYVAPPHVVISGGNGTGATAIANIDRQTGALTGIEITCPGFGYTGNPAFTLIGGGGSGATLNTTLRFCANTGGGLTKTGAGNLVLNAANTYTGPTRVEGGRLTLGHPQAIPPRTAIIIGDGTLDLGGHTLTNTSVTITGSGSVINGNIVTASAIKIGPGEAVLDAGIRFETFSDVIPGLWEGVFHGTNNAPNNTDMHYFNINVPNPKTSVQLTTRAANGIKTGNGTFPGGDLAGMWVGDRHQWIYTGYIWNRAPTNETWSFFGRFDDNVRIAIDGRQLFNAGNQNNVATLTLTPGPHAIDIRFGDNTGNVGPEAGWTSGLMYDPLGRNSDQPGDYLVLEDPGDGSLLTANLLGEIPADNTIRVLEGTLRLPSAEPGLYEGVFHGTGAGDYWNIAIPNPRDSVQLTTRAGNGAGPSAPNATYPGGDLAGMWAGNYHTWIYSGYIWNRTSASVTWTWRFTFDDNVYLAIDGNVVSNVLLNQGIVYADYTLTPGPHKIDIRYGDGTGNVGPASGLGGLTYTTNVGSTDVNDFRLLADSGGGELLTTGLNDPGTLSGMTIEVSAGATLDLGGILRDGLTVTGSGTVTAGPPPVPPVSPGNGLILSPAGDLATGPMSIDGLTGGSLNGAVYRATIHDPKNPLNIPGLWEGVFHGVIGAYWNTSIENPKDGGIQLTTRAGNGPIDSNAFYPGGDLAGMWAGNYHTWIYTGYVWNRAPTNVTWTWRFTFDDNVYLKIDGNVIRDHTLQMGVGYADYTLTPGPHEIDIRYGDGSGNVGPASGLGGLTYDPLGRGATDLDNYILLEDFGDGSLLTATAYTVDDGTCDLIIFNGTLDTTGLLIVPSDLASASPPGSTYVIGHATGGFTGALPDVSGFEDGRGWRTMRRGNDLLLTTKRGTVMILR